MVIGHQKQLEILTESAKRGRLAHAYLFSGPAKVGKKTLALEWLSRLLSIELSAGIAHPDFSFVGPLVDPKTGKLNKEIEISQIRDLINKLQLKTVAAPYKAAIIDQAHLLNSESQNALLKTLEEPSGRAVIILIADNVLRLLPTIVSRCEIVKFHFVSKSQLEILAREMKIQAGAKQLEEMLSLSLGRPGRLVDFGANEGEFLHWQEKIKEAEKIFSAGIGEKLNYIKRATSDESNQDTSELLEIWQYYFRQKMLATITAKSENPKEIAALSDAPRFVFTKNSQKNSFASEIKKIAAILEKINNLIIIFSRTNASQRLAMENLMLEI